MLAPYLPSPGPRQLALVRIPSCNFRSVIGVTRLQVYAGRAGLWVIREQRERDLGLPEGPPFESRLLIQDRNLAGSN
jgi:hypothetical protein